CFFFSSRRRHTRLVSDWSSDVCSSDLRSCPRRGKDYSPDESGGGRRNRSATAPAQYRWTDYQRLHRYEKPERSAAGLQSHEGTRSEERRVGKECRCGWWAYQ